jgi:hypothetical protein
MAVTAHSTNLPELPASELRGMSISTLSDLLDASDAAVGALLSVMNLPRTAFEACGQIEDWMEDFSFRRQALIAEMETRVPANKAEEVVRLNALMSRAYCETPFDVVAYVTRISGRAMQ